MTTALVTGATQGLGLALATGLAKRLEPADTVYVTGRNRHRIEAAVEAVRRTARAKVEGRSLDMADEQAAEEVAEELGGAGIVFGNAVMRVGPDDDPAAIAGQYTQVNNFGTTRLLRAFAPRLPYNGRLLVVASSFGTLHHLAPSLHHRFDGLGSLDEVDAATAAWRDEVIDGRAKGMAWPGFVNIPSKIAQVAAVRALAAERRAADADRGVLIAAVCPGMLNTPTSALWWDVSGAKTPEQGAAPLLDLALGEVPQQHYGELIREGKVVPWSHRPV